MITKDEYLKIRKHWKGRVYADDWIFPRLKDFVEFGQKLKGKKVLDIGCNAGVFGLEASKMAESYIGMEKEAFYYDQAKITKRYMPNPKTRIIKADLITMPEGLEFNAVMALFVIYHFYPPEVKIYRDKILPKCDVVVTQIRNGPRKTIKNDKGWHHPHKYTKFMEEQGFGSKVYWQKKKKQFVTIVSERENKG